MSHGSRRLSVLIALVSLAVVAMGSTQARAEKVLEPRAMAMGSAATALGGGLSAIQSNPATIGMGGAKGLEVGGLVGNDRLDAAFGAYTVPPMGESGASAVGIWRLADDVAGTESQAIAFGIQFPLDWQTSLGMALRHWRFSGAGAASTSKFDGDVGAVLCLDPDVNSQFVGVAVRNIAKPHSFAGQRVARRIAVGGSYLSPQGVLFALDYDDLTGQAGDAALRMGAEAMLTDRIVGRVGFNDWDLTVGVGVRASKYRVDYAFQSGDAGFDDYHLLGATFVF
jgi:hypothetical protein